MPVVRHTINTSVPRSTVFAYIQDPDNVPTWMFGVTKFEPTGEPRAGLGAVYDAAMRIGPKSLGSTIEVTEWEQDKKLVLTSIAGFDVSTRWHFSDADEATTQVHVEFGYTLPGGFAGRALAAVIDPVVGQAVRQTEATLRGELEQP